MVEGAPADSGREMKVAIGTIRPDEDATVARIYMQHFAERLEPSFSTRRAAVAFSLDMMRLLRRAYPDTFWVARLGGEPRGFLILTLPGTHLARALLDPRFSLPAIGSAIVGRYGLPFRPLGRVLTSLTRADGEDPPGASDWAHVESVAVDVDCTGHGIGSRLLAHALEWAAPRYAAVWLKVSTGNGGAVRLYERSGFETLSSHGGEAHMVWTSRGRAGP